MRIGLIEFLLILAITADFKNLELNTNINKNCYENFAH